jgi:hypothetical protein
MWQYPEIRVKLLLQADRLSDIPKIHSMPTGFPEMPGIAYRWATRPWLIEKAKAHGQKPLSCGSIKLLFKVLA